MATKKKTAKKTARKISNRYTCTPTEWRVKGPDPDLWAYITNTCTRGYNVTCKTSTGYDGITGLKTLAAAKKWAIDGLKMR